MISRRYTGPCNNFFKNKVGVRRTEQSATENNTKIIILSKKSNKNILELKFHLISDKKFA